MDPNVIGRLMVETQPDFDRPVVTRLAVLDVSDESHGNIVGVGFADLTTERLVSKIDPEPFRINILTSCCLERCRIPITLPTDRDVIEAALETCWRIDPAEARMVVIPNTLELETLWVSPPLEEEVRAHPHLTRETEYLPIPFSADGTLDQEAMFPRERPRASLEASIRRDVLNRPSPAKAREWLTSWQERPSVRVSARLGRADFLCRSSWALPWQGNDPASCG